MAPARPVPRTDDRDTGGFWAAAAEGRLAIRMCASCGAVLHLPRAYCHRCRTWSERWAEVSGRGRLYTWTTVEHQVHPAFPVPYTVVLVELEDHPGTRLVGHMEGVPDLVPNQAMQVWFERLDDGVALPQWKAATD